MASALGLSLLAALSAGVLSFAAISWWERRSEARVSKGIAEEEQGHFERWGQWLQMMPIPAALARTREDGELEAKLAASGVAWNRRAFLGARWLALVAAIQVCGGMLLLVSTGIVHLFLAACVLALSWWGPPAWLSFRAGQRQREIRRALPDFLDRFVLALEAGLGFEIALRRTALRTEGILGHELARVMRMLNWGQRKNEALASMMRRVSSAELRAICASILQADRLGTPLAATLRVQSDLLRARRRRAAEEAGRRMPVLVVFPLVFFFLPSLLIIYLAPPLLHLFLGR